MNAAALQRLGAVPGDRAAIYLQNIPQALIVVLAAWKCGAAIVPCNPMLKAQELAKVLCDSGSRFLVCQEDLYANVVRAALPATAVAVTITTSPLDLLCNSDRPSTLAGLARLRYPEAADLLQLVRDHAGRVPVPPVTTGSDPAFLIYTSGTTGEPRAAVNTHQGLHRGGADASRHTA